MKTNEMATGEINILVVEDEQGLVELFEIWLGDTYNVTTATSGEAARQLLDESIDVVILDWRLPDCSGEDIVTYMQENGFEASIAVVTGAEPNDGHLSPRVDLVLQKPIAREELHDGIELLLSKQ